METCADSWCDRCDISYADYRVTFTEQVCEWSSDNFVQYLCDECMNVRRTEAHGRKIWGLEVSEI